MTDAGRTLAGRYRLLSEIGRGGMGTVHRARDEVLDREVAIKLLPASVADRDPVNVTRFEREARAAATLNHPGVISVYDAGEDGGERFIVMELVEGESLHALIRRQGALAPGRAARIAAAVADALAVAHAAGIVHRDIKPANVMVRPNGGVTVLDFGIARLADAATLTLTDTVLGTAAYMSPEQVLGEPATARSDLYALGCVLFAMLTGHPPFRRESAAAVLHAQTSHEAPPPSADQPGIPPALDALTLALLAKDPRARPQRAVEVRDRLAAAAGAARGTADDAAAAAAPGATATPATATAPTRAAADATRVRPAATAPPRVIPTPPAAALRRRGPLAALAVTAAAVVALIVILSSGGQTPPRTAATTRTTAHTTSRSATAPAATPVNQTTTGTASSTSTTSTTPTTATPARPAASPGPAKPPGKATPPGQATPPGKATPPGHAKDHGPKPDKGHGKPG